MTSVYVMQNDYGLTKIGISSNVHNRVNALKNSSGIGVEICWYSEPMDRLLAREIEKAAHERFSESRCYGEWFTGLDVEKVVGYLVLRMNIDTFKLKELPREFKAAEIAETTIGMEDACVKEYLRYHSVFNIKHLRNHLSLNNLSMNAKDLYLTLNKSQYSKARGWSCDGTEGTYYHVKEVTNHRQAIGVCQLENKK